MDVVTMIQDQLKIHKLDGLFNTNNECGCVLGADFIPCGELLLDCCGGINIPFLDDLGDFKVTSTKHALNNWPDCPDCSGSSSVQIGQKPTDSCDVCRNTGKVLRGKSDYELLGNLFYERSYKKVLAESKI